MLALSALPSLSGDVCVCFTQVASLNDGSFLVADGYCNSRVLRFNPDGSFHSVYQFTAKGRVRDMAVVHSLVVDECDGALVVADRENKAVHTFNLHTGAYRGEEGRAPLVHDDAIWGELRLQAGFAAAVVLWCATALMPPTAAMLWYVAELMLAAGIVFTCTTLQLCN